MSSLEVPLWWDRDVDRTGRTIRLDVREAALSVWRTACRRNQTVAADPSQSADLMEGTVSQISRYLDRKNVTVFSRDIEALIAHSCQRAVHREQKKRNRFLPLDDPAKLSEPGPTRSWHDQIVARLELEEVIKLLGDQSRRVLALRYAGYTWRETASLMGLSVAAVRSAFWRDVNGVRRRVGDKRHGNCQGGKDL
jgi:DNA-directed RNA polymerase specialized sigma24 family protein